MFCPPFCRWFLAVGVGFLGADLLIVSFLAVDCTMKYRCIFWPIKDIFAVLDFWESRRALYLLALRWVHVPRIPPFLFLEYPPTCHN